MGALDFAEWYLRSLESSETVVRFSVSDPKQHNEGEFSNAATKLLVYLRHSSGAKAK